MFPVPEGNSKSVTRQIVYPLSERRHEFPVPEGNSKSVTRVELRFVERI